MNGRTCTRIINDIDDKTIIEAISHTTLTKAAIEMLRRTCSADVPNGFGGCAERVRRIATREKMEHHDNSTPKYSQRVTNSTVHQIGGVGWVMQAPPSSVVTKTSNLKRLQKTSSTQTYNRFQITAGKRRNIIPAPRSSTIPSAISTYILENQISGHNIKGNYPLYPKQVSVSILLKRCSHFKTDSN